MQVGVFSSGGHKVCLPADSQFFAAGVTRAGRAGQFAQSELTILPPYPCWAKNLSQSYEAWQNTVRPSNLRYFPLPRFCTQGSVMTSPPPLADLERHGGRVTKSSCASHPKFID